MGNKTLVDAFLETYSRTHNYNMTWYRKNFGGIDPYQGQGRILSALRRMHSTKQKDLGLILEIRPQSLGELLQKLEKNGYIRRYRSTTDKRALMVELTEKGENFQLQKPDYDELFADLTPRERTVLKGALVKISDKLNEMIEQEDEYEYEVY